MVKSLENILLICYTKRMKTVQCQHCEREFTAATKEALLSVLYDHYMKDHHAIITSIDEAGKKAWMEKFTVDWDSAQSEEHN